MAIYTFCGNRGQYAICIIGLGGMDAPAILPFFTPICPPKPVPIPHASYTPSHSPSPHPLIPPSSLTLPSPAPSSRIPRHSTSLPPYPLLTSFLPFSSCLSIPLPIPYPSTPVSFLPTRYYPSSAFPQTMCEAIGSYLINHFPPIPD